MTVPFRGKLKRLGPKQSAMVFTPMLAISVAAMLFVGNEIALFIAMIAAIVSAGILCMLLVYVVDVSRATSILLLAVAAAASYAIFAWSGINPDGQWAGFWIGIAVWNAIAVIMLVMSSSDA